MEKKVYFLNAESIDCKETHASLSNEEFAKRADIVYDSIESFIDDFNRGKCPPVEIYYCRII